MRKSILLSAAIAALSIIASPPAHAVAVTPTYTTFGPLPAATFNGTDIPNDRVAVTRYTPINGSRSQIITLGLTATERFANPAVGDDGAGTFFAVTGGDSPATYARWNFDFYADPGQLSTAGYKVGLYYEFDPALGNDESTLKTLGTASLTAVLQDSWNLGMPFLTAGSPGGGPVFDPTLNGEYSFILKLFDSANNEVARSAINVNVGAANSVPDTGSTLALLGLSFVGLAGASRKLRGKEVLAS